MDLTRIAPKDRQHIQKYGPSGFTVSGVAFNGPIVVFSDQSYVWNVESIDTLTSEMFAPVLNRANEIDLCLLGCGQGMKRIPASIKDRFKEQGVGIEPMDTGAACRTFNVLLAEGRSLAVALFPPTSS
jgi:uncharacterized protein